jgi:hypothetical protein
MVEGSAVVNKATRCRCAKHLGVAVWTPKAYRDRLCAIMDPPAGELLQYGALGILCLILLTWIYYKDKQSIQEAKDHRVEVKDIRTAHKAEIEVLRIGLTAEQTARVEDAKSFTTTALELQERAMETVLEIRGIVEEYGALGETVGQLVAVLKRRNGHDGD